VVASDNRGAQSQAVPNSGPVLQISPPTGAPLVVEQVEQRTHVFPDGTSTGRTVRSKIYRDRAGRMRVEWAIEAGEDASFPIAYLIDPLARFAAILIPGNVAHRTALAGSEAFWVGFPAIGEALPEVQWRTNTEELGKRTIEGIEALGTRITRICHGQPSSLRASDERWLSKDLGITLTAEVSGPNWKHTVRVQIIDRSEPDADLFAIPSAYAIKDSKR